MADLSVQAFVEARRHERERLTRILHDEVAGGLTAAGLSLDLLAMDAPPELVPRVREIQAMLEQSFDSVRDLSAEFHPDPAVRSDLPQALEGLARRFQKRFHGKLDIQISPKAGETIGAEQARACYAVAEAALDNVLAHSGAGVAWLTLERLDGRKFRLSVRDDGRGFEESTTRGGTGTAMMEYHVLIAGLELSIRSKVGHGTWVRVYPVGTPVKKRGSHEDGY